MNNKKRLEIKSHGDELLKEVDEYLKKHKRIVSIEDDPSTVEILKKLKDEVEFLQRVLKNNEDNKEE